MKSNFSKDYNIFKIAGLLILLFIITFSSVEVNGQNIRFGVFADPVISWFSSDTKETVNDGARAGFNFGFTFNKYFSSNYSFSTGINIMNAGGRISNSDTIEMVFNNFNTEVPAGSSVVYRVQYLCIPAGLKFETNQIGYMRFYTDIGIDPKVVIGGKVDIADAGIEGESASKELRLFNLAYHIMAGIGYSLGGNTEIIFGLGYENNFLDISDDINLQPKDRLSQNILKFRFGINF